MSADAPQSGPRGRAFTVQVVNGAIVLGVVLFLAALLVVRAHHPPPPRDPPLVSYIALGITAFNVLVAVILPNLVAAAGRRRLASAGAAKGLSADVGAWYALYQTSRIIRLAVLDGATLLLIVAWFLEGWTVPLLVVPLLIAAMLLQFPSAGRVERWVEAQKELAYQDRPLS